MLFTDSITSCLQKIKEGDEEAREILIEEAKPFIAKVTGRLCGRSLSWERDDELSIGLIAFNEAIDRYNEKQGVPFAAFARLVIKSRVTDYLRKESKWHHTNRESLEQLPEVSANPAENAVCWEKYLAEIANRERKEEILAFQRRLSELGIAFSDLVHCSPKHRETRQRLLAAARYLVEQPSLYKELLASKRLPLREIMLGTGMSRKVLERGRKYIIAVAILLYNRDEFIYLNAYVGQALGDGGR